MVFHQFMDRYFPYPLPAAPAYANAKADAKTVTGEYMSTRRSQTNILWITAMLGEDKVAANSDGTLTAGGMNSPNGKLWKWTEIAPLQYRASEGQDRIAFTRHPDGTMVLGIDFPAQEYQRVPWYQRKSLNSGLFYFMLAVFLLTVVLWPVASFIRRHYGNSPQLDRAPLPSSPSPLSHLSDRPHRGRLFLLDSCPSSNSAEALSDPQLDLKLRLMQLIILIGVLWTVVPLLNLFRPWSAGLPPASIGAAAPRRWWVMRVHDLLIALACLAFCWFAIYWHLLVLSLRF